MDSEEVDQRNHNPARFLQTNVLTDDQLEPIFTFDQGIFGADRSLLLCSLRDRSPDFAMGVWSDGSPQGYAFGRNGLFADHLGPWVARAGQPAENFSRNSWTALRARLSLWTA